MGNTPTRPPQRTHQPKQSLDQLIPETQARLRHRDRRLLDLRPGMSVLDLACGHGDLANALAARDCRVTGLDSSTVFLDRARTDAAAAGVDVEYVAGDMRAIPWTGRFDRVVNWSTAFGYFDDATNRAVLDGIVR